MRSKTVSPIAVHSLPALLLVIAACFGAPIVAQVPLLISPHLAPFAVGVHDKQWDNPTGSGSPVIDTRVYYPATQSGVDASSVPSTHGWPVVFFLHGYGMMGSDYAAFGTKLAKAGFAAVMIDTSRHDPLGLEADARALYALLQVPRGVRGVLRGVFDADRIGLLGHSMGGAVTALLLAETAVGGPPGLQNPGFETGVAISPVYPGPIAGDVNRPFGIISGEGDPVTFEALHADPFYQDVRPAEGLKFHYSMGLACEHDSPAGINVVGGQVNQAVFHRASSVAIGFLSHYLAGTGAGLEGVFGDAALQDANLDELQRQAVLPQMWVSSPPVIGGAMRVGVVCENGFAALLAASDTIGPVMTELGSLMLDPLSMVTVVSSLVGNQQLDVLMQIPSDPTLVGVTFAMQGIGETPDQQIRLGSSLRFEVQ